MRPAVVEHGAFCYDNLAMQRKFFSLLLICISIQGCASLAMQTLVPMMEGQMASMKEETDPLLAKQAIPTQLKMLEGFLKSDGSNTQLLNSLAEGFCGFAFSFVEDEDTFRASALYLRGKKYAEEALKYQTGWVSSNLPLAGFQSSLDDISKEALPSLFWLGQCWGGWLLLNLDDLSAFADISKVESIMTRVLDWDPAYHYSGPHLFLGGFYGGRSRMLGGNPEKAKYHFEESLRITDRKYLLNQLLYAKTYAVQSQNRELFEKLLKEILQTSDDLLPKQRLANAVAKIKAKSLLELADDLF